MIKNRVKLLLVWLSYFLSRSLLATLMLSLTLVAMLYLYKGAVTLDSRATEALWLLFKSLFALVLPLVSTIFFVTSVKALHNRCVDGIKVMILGCDGQALDRVSLDDAFKVARRWLTLSMWVLMAVIVILSVLYYSVSVDSSPVDWMGVKTVYPLFIISALLAFFLLLHRCKKVDIIQC